jgi:hypothetical protein
MNTETVTRAARPLPWLLIGLGVAIIALLAVRMWPTGSATPSTPASNPTAAAKAEGGQEKVNPSDLDVRLEALQAERPKPAEVGRNPFRFEAKAAPPPPPTEELPSQPGVPKDQQPAVPSGPPQPPPISLKFHGTVEKQGLKVAALSDCKGSTFYGREGDTIDGRYRLIRIGVESAIIEYVNGTGRTTLRLEGCSAR